MRRIYKTTTAIVACLALVAPQIAVAQDQQDGGMPETSILPQEAQEQLATEQVPAQPAAEPPVEPVAEAAAPAPEPEQPTEVAQDPPQEQPQPETQTEQQNPPEQQNPTEQPQPEMQPAQEPATEPAEPAPAAELAPQPEAPTAKPPVTQAEQPQEKPAVVQAEQPAAKPENAAEDTAKAEAVAPEVQKAPQPKPDTAKAVTETAPAAKPATEMPTEQLAQPEPAPTAPISAEALRKKLEAETGQTGAETGPAPDAQTANTGQPAELPAELPNELPAPEATAQPNAVAQRAAEQVAAPTAAALSAGADAAQGQMSEIVVTQENTRSSAEDFATTVAQGLQSGDATKQARDDDDNGDRNRDIAKLLLAGAAGFAVGKMLSNDRQVALNTGDRVVVTLPDGSQQVIKDDNALLYRPGSNVQTETFQDGSTRTTVLRADGSRVVTIRDANMNTLRRTLIRTDGSETQLIDDTTAQPVRVSTLPAPPPVEVIRRPLNEDALREALRREAQIDRRFSLGQVRDIPEVRALVAPVNVPEVTFDTGSAAITPDQARQLATLGKVIRDSIDQNPREIYMIEGYTDAVGSNAANLALSDRRAESIALALTEYFQVPPENMVVQGYGEQFLLIPTEGAERQNRRVAVRRITQLLAAN